MDLVCVLLSTYNGEKYIKEQIESLLIQANVNLQIIARDDGSKDNTIKLLEEYSKRDSRFKFYEGKNIGPARSFMDLIDKAVDADYYAFCDQDDVWDKDKLECATTMLNDLDLSKPALYYSNLRIVDQNLKYYRLSHEVLYTPYNKYSALVENLATGCTIVFNKAARNMIKGRVPENCSMHDTWLFLVCSFFGSTVYDFDAHISYRQHEKNVIGAHLSKRTLTTYLVTFKRLFNRDLQPRFNNAKSFYSEFDDLLNEQDNEKVCKMVSYKNSLSERLRLLFDRDIRSTQISRDLSYRLLILLGIA